MQERQDFLRSAAQSHLLNFAQLVDKNYIASWFHERIAEVLEQALQNTVNGKKSRIILSIPPRHGKTQLASIFFPAWALGRYPELKFILATYGAELSEEVGMKTRDLINNDAYQNIFNGVKLKADTKAKAKWMTDKGGSYTAVGVGGAITGKGGQIILIDDLLKDRAEAESENISNTAWDYYRSTLYSRQEGNAAIIVIMQRWNQKDIVARLLEEDKLRKESGGTPENWEVINFPAIAVEDEYHPITHKLLRKEGQVLWPEKYDLAFLESQKQQSPYFWSSQYQQDPIMAETAEFKVEMFRYFNEEELTGKYLRYYTIVDPAISQKKSADNTVVLTVAKEVNGPNIYRIREDAGRFTPQETVDLIFKHTGEYNSELWLETIAYQASLKFLIQEKQRLIQRYFTVYELKSSTKKEERIRGLLGLYQTGVIWHRKSDSNYELELLAFPNGRRDDRADCMAYILQALKPTNSSIFAHTFIPKWAGYRKKR